MNRRNVIVTGGIVAVGIVIGIFLTMGGKSSVNTSADSHAAKEIAQEGGGNTGTKTQEGESESIKGPHGGRLLTQGSFAIEVTIHEQGGPPEFRVYAYEAGKPSNPGEVSLQIQLERLGAPPETINFQAKQDFLSSDREIVEPHSFAVRVMAQRKGQAYRWNYEQSEGRVRIDDAAAQSAGIRIDTAGPAKIQSTLQLSGEIQFNQDRLAHVVPRLDGVVIKSAKSLGDQVREGELLAVLESRMLADLKTEHLATQTRLDLATTTFEREKRLWEERISAEQDYLASRQALAEAQITHRNVQQKLLALGLDHTAIMRGGADGLTRYEVRAPIDGVVIEKHLSIGEAVKEDASIFTIADLSTVWAEMIIYPKDLDSVKIGQKVTVRATGLDAEAAGRVSYVGSLVGEQTRSAKARVTLQNPNRSWRPGLFVTVELVQSEAEVPVAVAVEAIQTYRDGKVVFVRFGEFFEARPVEPGRTDGQWIEVVNGVSPGTKYAASNSFVLKAELGKSSASHDH
ncbi:MAG TPA: efflux RND transporter periplasmic adaptor subunit [Burkholderiales bacterium]|nr:efflux RND transporter periplasmic adaptor subunit [Burkholderiales bacterium]